MVVHMRWAREVYAFRRALFSEMGRGTGSGAASGRWMELVLMDQNSQRSGVPVESLVRPMGL